MRRLVALAGLVAACGAPADRPDGPPGCGLTVSFDEQTRADGLAAIERVNAASGCWVAEADDGVPVSAVPIAFDDGVPMCGTTGIATYDDDGAFAYVVEIRVSTYVGGCMSREDTLVHELIHAMIGKRGVHAERGVFAIAGSAGGALDESSLSALCKHVACPMFAPEG